MFCRKPNLSNKVIPSQKVITGSDSMTHDLKRVNYYRQPVNPQKNYSRSFQSQWRIYTFLKIFYTFAAVLEK